MGPGGELNGVEGMASFWVLHMRYRSGLATTGVQGDVSAHVDHMHPFDRTTPITIVPETKRYIFWARNSNEG